MLQNTICDFHVVFKDGTSETFKDVMSSELSQMETIVRLNFLEPLNSFADIILANVKTVTCTPKQSPLPESES